MTTSGRPIPATEHRRAVLSGRPAERALVIAEEVASRMLDEPRLERTRAATASALQRAGAPGRRWSAPGLSGAGCSGAVLCAELDRIRPGDGWDRRGHGLLSSAARTAENDAAPLGLFDGLAGVGFTAYRLAAGRERYQSLLAAVDGAVVTSVTARCTRLTSADRFAAGEWDLISGVTGLGVYLLARDLPTTREALEQILSALVKLSHEAGGVPRWATPSEHLFGYLRELTPNGCVNCGLAHGVPGPLALMSLARLRGIEVAGQLDAIATTTAWLAALARPGRWGPEWPVGVPLAAAPDAAPLPAARPGWCYGNAGVARSLWLAGGALDGPEYQELALHAVRQALTRQREERPLGAATFCHGIAGLAQVAVRMAAATGDEALGREAQSLCLELLDRFEPGSAFGFRDLAATPEGSPFEVDDPTLLAGAPGTALVLLAAAAGEGGWDRAMLLS